MYEMSGESTEGRQRERDHGAGRARRARGREEEPRLIWLREEPRARRPSLTRQRIAQAALAIADADGFEAVSMRRVAQELGAGTMTLYHYVANKDELITLMMDEVMGEVLVPDEELAAEWRGAMTQIAGRSREAFRRHPWILDRLGDGRPGPNGIRHFEQSLQAMAAAEVPDKIKFEVIGQIDEYVFGFGMREAQEFAEHARGWPQDVQVFFQRELDSGRYPLIHKFLGGDAGTAIDRVAEVLFDPGRFERGLARLLDGIEANMAADASR